MCCRCLSTEVYYAPGLANATVTVTPRDAVEVVGWPLPPGDGDGEEAHVLRLVSVRGGARVTVVIEKTR